MSNVQTWFYISFRYSWCEIKTLYYVFICNLLFFNWKCMWIVHWREWNVYTKRVLDFWQFFTKRHGMFFSAGGNYILCREHQPNLSLSFPAHLEHHIVSFFFKFLNCEKYFQIVIYGTFGAKIFAPSARKNKPPSNKPPPPRARKRNKSPGGLFRSVFRVSI